MSLKLAAFGSDLPSDYEALFVRQKLAGRLRKRFQGGIANLFAAHGKEQGGGEENRWQRTTHCGNYSILRTMAPTTRSGGCRFSRIVA